MDVLVRQQAAPTDMFIPVGEKSRVESVFTGLMMLDTDTAQAICQGKQEVIAIKVVVQKLKVSQYSMIFIRFFMMNLEKFFEK